MNDKTFCVYAKYGLAIQNDGLMNPCSHSQEYFTDNSNELMYVHSHSLNDAWHSKKRIEIVNALDQGIRHNNCYQCWHAEDAGLRSARISANTLWKDRVKDLDHPQLITLKPGNGCNLKCRTCTPWISNQWYQDYYQGNFYPEGKVNSYSEFIGIFEHTKKSWDSNNTLIWDWLHIWASDVIFWDLYGAEPMINTKLWNFFSWCSEQGYLPDYSAHVNTNGTIYHQKYAELFAAFKLLNLDISIDGIGKQFEYLRHPAVWEVQEQNLLRYRDLQTAHPSIQMLAVVTTVSIFNIFYTPEIFEYVKQLGIEINLNNMVFNPDHYDMRVLPAAVKTQIVDKLNNYEFALSDGHKEQWHNYTKPGLIGFLMQDVADQDHKFKDFWKFTQRYDQLRGEDFASTFPEFHALITPYLQ